MDGNTENFEALAETTVFLQYFRDMPDCRQAGKVTYPLDEILLLCLLAVLAGSEAFTEIARFGEKKLALLRRFRPFKDGTPAHDHLGDIFATLDAGAFQRCFVAWAAALTKTPAEVIAIDGKSLRRSYQKKGSKAPIHMVSAFAARQRLVMAQTAVAEKSNEIVAIPALLDMMEIEGAVISIDADRASNLSQRFGVIVHSIYVTGVGRLGRNAWEVQLGQGGIAKIADETGGEYFSLGTLNPISFQPFLGRLQRILDNQYFLVFQATPRRNEGLQRVNISTDLPNFEIAAANNVWVPAAAR